MLKGAPLFFFFFFWGGGGVVRAAFGFLKGAPFLFRVAPCCF